MVASARNKQKEGTGKITPHTIESSAALAGHHYAKPLLYRTVAQVKVGKGCHSYD